MGERHGRGIVNGGMRWKLQLCQCFGYLWRCVGMLVGQVLKLAWHISMRHQDEIFFLITMSGAEARAMLLRRMRCGFCVCCECVCAREEWERLERIRVFTRLSVSAVWLLASCS